MKRFFDVILSISMVFLLSPILIITSIMIKMDSSGCVLFKQKRVGKLGKPFFIYKFRSMVENADKQGLYQTKENDIRITPVGRFIRRTSIDELPQLFNVIQGSMSLVGPRPNVFLQQKLYSQRHQCLTGIYVLHRWDSERSISKRQSLCNSQLSSYHNLYLQSKSA